MLQDIITVLAAGLGTVGFALFYNLRKKLFLCIFPGSVLMAVIYIVLQRATIDLLVTNIVCAAIATAISEIMARVIKVPATVLLIPMILPLVPGGYLYYTMYGVVTKNPMMIRENAAATIQIALGIAIGIVIISILFAFGRRKLRHQN